MIGGGIIFIDDKARGLHEGYLVTPISKFELILGFNLAGAAKAIIAGARAGDARLADRGHSRSVRPLRMARMLVLVVVTALALISMMFLLMVRVSDPLVPRAIFGVLNTVLYFPSGAVYPTQAFPAWMKAITVVDPFTYAVHGFKELARGASLSASSLTAGESPVDSPLPVSARAGSPAGASSFASMLVGATARPGRSPVAPEGAGTDTGVIVTKPSPVWNSGVPVRKAPAL
jgi:hypothetical protein